jgi:hypothetical protein
MTRNQVVYDNAEKESEELDLKRRAYKKLWKQAVKDLAIAVVELDRMRGWEAMKQINPDKA